MWGHSLKAQKDSIMKARIGLCCALLAATALMPTQSLYAYMPSLKEPDVDQLKERVYADWAPSKKIVGYWINGRISPDGRVHDLTIEAGERDSQSDADCLMAVMGASKSCRMVGDGDKRNVFFRFDVDSPAGSYINVQASGIEKYFGSHPDQKERHIAFYRIPLDALKRYPGLFAENELLADGNIGIMKATVNSGLSVSEVERLRTIYLGTWEPFFIAHPSATKQQILEIRDKLPFDDMHPALVEK